MNAGAYGGDISQVVAFSRWFDMNTGEVGVYEGNAHDFRYRHSAYMDNNRIILSAGFRLPNGERKAIEAKMNDYMSRRHEKQPLEYPSAGSVFKRGNGFITAELIEGAGLKGRRVGGAEVSEKHAGFIINIGNATANDVLQLIKYIQDKAFQQFGVNLQPEIVIIGEE
jgi:UDP-N-acetylmuramate dehydrogenase